MEFTSKKIEDLQAINTASISIANSVIPANDMKREYTKLFSYFELEDLMSLIKCDNKPKWIANKWIQINNIEVDILSIDQYLKRGLLNIPDYDPLIKSIHYFKAYYLNQRLAMYLNDISDLYCFETNCFINPLDESNSLVSKRINEMFTIESANERENQCIEDIEHLARLYSKFCNEWQIVTVYQIPTNLLTVNVFNGLTVIGAGLQVLKHLRRKSLNCLK